MFDVIIYAALATVVVVVFYSVLGKQTGCATAAYSMILEAYANGDRELLSDLLTDETYAIYDAAITAREEAEQTQITDATSSRTPACTARGNAYTCSDGSSA